MALRFGCCQHYPVTIAIAVGLIEIVILGFVPANKGQRPSVLVNYRTFVLGQIIGGIGPSCIARAEIVLDKRHLVQRKLGGKRTAFVFPFVTLGNQLGAVFTQFNVVVAGVIVGDFDVFAVVVHIPTVKLIAIIRRSGKALCGTLLLSNDALALGVNQSTFAGGIRIVNTFERIVQFNGIRPRHGDGGLRGISIKRIIISFIRYRLVVLEHRKRLACNALYSSAHTLVFDIIAIFVFEEVSHVNRTRGAIGNIVGVLRDKRQIAVALAVAIPYVLNDVFTCEIESVTGSIDGAAFVAFNLPTEEYHAPRSGGHAIGHHSSGVINDVIGVGVGNLARALA